MVATEESVDWLLSAGRVGALCTIRRNGISIGGGGRLITPMYWLGAEPAENGLALNFRRGKPDLFDDEVSFEAVPLPGAVTVWTSSGGFAVHGSGPIGPAPDRPVDAAADALRQSGLRLPLIEVILGGVGTVPTLLCGDLFGADWVPPADHPLVGDCAPTEGTLVARAGDSHAVRHDEGLEWDPIKWLEEALEAIRCGEEDWRDRDDQAARIGAWLSWYGCSELVRREIEPVVEAVPSAQWTTLLLARLLGCVNPRAAIALLDRLDAMTDVAIDPIVDEGARRAQDALAGTVAS